MKVVYNGKNRISYKSTNPASLKMGEVYDVVGTRDYGICKHYILKDVDGEYETSWFSILQKTVLVFIEGTPRVNSLLECLDARTSEYFTINPRNAFPIGIDTYYIECGSDVLYIAQLI